MTDVGDIDIFIKPSDMNLAKKHLETILEDDDETFFSPEIILLPTQIPLNIFVETL